MFTQCQYCDSRFEVDIVQLRATLGVMNCSQCNKEFNAIDALYYDEITSTSEMNEKTPQLNGIALPAIDHVLNDEFIVSTGTAEPEWVDISIKNENEWNIDDEVNSILNEENKTLEYLPKLEIEKYQQLSEDSLLVKEWNIDDEVKSILNEESKTSEEFLELEIERYQQLSEVALLANEWDIDDEVKSILNEENKTSEEFLELEIEKYQQLSEVALLTNEWGIDDEVKSILNEDSKTSEQSLELEIEKNEQLPEESIKKQEVPELLLGRWNEKENIKNISELEILESFLGKINEYGNVDTLSEPDISEPLLEKQNKEESVEKLSSSSNADTVWWSITIFSMIVLLAFQYIYFARNQLAEHDGLRAPLITMCSVLGCRIPLKKSIDKIQLVHTSVQGHGNIKDALVVSASYVNKASFVQPYPILELVLFDMEQRAVMSRQFYPNEYLLDYLADKENIEAGASPDTSIQARLEIVDPGKNTVNFEFNFL